MNNQQIRLSPSLLSLYLECLRCFWMYKVKGVHRPEQSFALQSNFDRVLKPYFDKFRAQGELPPELKGQVEGKLMPNQELLEKWRNVREPALTYQDKKYKDFVLVGALDDCLVDGECYIPIDFKITGASAFEANAEKYYQHQLDIYNFLLEQNGYKTKGVAYLVYYKPKEVINTGVIKFRVGIKKMETSRERAKKLFENGIEVLRGPMPVSHSECKYCSWAMILLSLAKSKFRSKVEGN